jgi:hypothetical protein
MACGLEFSRISPSSPPPSRAPGSRWKAADAVRKRWGIENKQHYTRDVTLREDASRIRCNPGIFARLRSFAYNILRFNQSDTIPQDRYAAALGGLESLSDMNYYKERWTALPLQQSRTSVIPEQIGACSTSIWLARRHVPHLEHGGAAAGRTG